MAVAVGMEVKTGLGVLLDSSVGVGATLVWLGSVVCVGSRGGIKAWVGWRLAVGVRVAECDG